MTTVKYFHASRKPALRPALARALLGIALCFCGLLANNTASAQVALLFGDLTWERVDTTLAKSFPEVKNISTEELAKSTPLRLLDVREEAEYQLSHIAGAKRWSGFDNLDSNKSAPIVVYCSVGARSAKIANDLQQRGYTNVRNLQGSIFKWANEGRPLVDSAGNPANKVHPYNKRWGVLVNEAKRAPLP